MACGRGCGGAGTVGLQGPSGGSGKWPLSASCALAGAARALLPQQLTVLLSCRHLCWFCHPSPRGRPCPRSWACPSPAACPSGSSCPALFRDPRQSGDPSTGVKFLQLPSGCSGHKVTLGELRPPRHPPRRRKGQHGSLRQSLGGREDWQGPASPGPPRCLPGTGVTAASSGRAEGSPPASAGPGGPHAAWREAAARPGLGGVRALSAAPSPATPEGGPPVTFRHPSAMGEDGVARSAHKDPETVRPSVSGRGQHLEGPCPPAVEKSNTPRPCPHVPHSAAAQSPELTDWGLGAPAGSAAQTPARCQRVGRWGLPSARLPCHPPASRPPLRISASQGHQCGVWREQRPENPGGAWPSLVPTV